MASKSNQNSKISEEQVAISEHQQNPQQVNAHVTDSDPDSDSGLHGSSSGFKLQSTPLISPAKCRGVSRNANSSKKRKRSQISKKSSSNASSRKWELDDEIVLLSKMCEIKSSDGKVDEKSLFESLKGKLQGNYSIVQLRNKMRNMRTKYVMCVKVGDVANLDAHDAVMFRLSEKVWGDVALRTNEIDANENGVGGVNVTSIGDEIRKENGVDGEKSGGKNVNRESVLTENGVGGKNVSVSKGVHESVENGVGGTKSDTQNVKSVATENVDVNIGIIDQNEKEETGEGNFVSIYERLCESTAKLMKENLNLIGKANGNELDDEWKMLWMEEVELNHKKAVVWMKQIELVYDRIKNS